MRSLILFSSMVWAASLAQSRLESLQTVGAITELLAALGTLAGLLVAVYRLGIWRQQMNAAKDNIDVRIAVYRAEATRTIAQLDQRYATLERALDRFMQAVAERRVNAERWRVGVDASLGSLVTRVDKLEGRLEEEAA